VQETARSILIGAVLAAATAAPALGWGSTGHQTLSRAGAQAFPASLPAFIRTPDAIDAIAALSVQPDRSKGSGNPHDADRDPGHYLDLGDDGSVDGAVSLDALPPSREAYDTALRAARTDQYRVGFLPFSIIDGWEQIVKDFAIWRADTAGLRTSTQPDDRGFFERDRRLWEMLTIRDIGVWSHYVGDASQPLHVSIHYNGWGPYPNPSGYSTDNHLHARFEGAFVRAHVLPASVQAGIAPYAPCNCTIGAYVGSYLRATNANVVPLYKLEAVNGFSAATPEAIAFTTARIAAGSTALRDLVVMAWDASAAATVGYPPVKVSDIESGAVIPTRATFGSD
jgi:hypothetical protein